jgi:hypothetical protein
MSPLLRPFLPLRQQALRAVATTTLLVSAVGCASTGGPIKRPTEPLMSGEPAWPDDVKKEADQIDRTCGTREAQLLYDYQEGKEEQGGFKTIIGSITGGIGTAGGVAAGVGALVIKDPDAAKKMTGVTSFVTGGLGAIGSVITAVVSPGASKMKSSSDKLTTIDQKKEAARKELAKDPGTWSDADKDAWKKTSGELDAACK